jgi:hypothetical protein
MAKNEKSGTPTAPINPKDRVATCGQLDEVARLLLDILKSVEARTHIADVQWNRHAAALSVIALREPPGAETPAPPRADGGGLSFEKQAELVEKHGLMGARDALKG